MQIKSSQRGGGATHGSGGCKGSKRLLRAGTAQGCLRDGPVKKTWHRGSHRKADDQQNGCAPGWPRRKPIRGKAHSEGAAEPSTLFFAVERVIQTHAAAREQSRVRFVVLP